jgi:2-dehydropantoate 2-reductase
MEIAIVPAGAVGAYLGGRLAATGTGVRLLARGAHLAALRQDGLDIRSPAGDLRLPPAALVVSDDAAAAVREAGVVLFAPKSFDTEAVAAALHPGLADDAVVISLQNGIENEAVLARLLGPRRVAAGAIYVEAEPAAPGVVVHRRLGRLVLADRTMDHLPLAAKADLDAALTAAGFTVEWSGDPLTLKWRKLIAISALSGWTAAARRKLDALLADPELHTAVAATLLETAVVAQAAGAQLDPVATAQGLLQFMGTLGDMGSSLLFDLEHGRRLEIEALNGAVVRTGHALGQPTPYNQALYALLGAADPGRTALSPV